MAESPEANSNESLVLKISSNDIPIKDAIGVVSVTVNKAVNRIPMARIVIADGDLPNKDFPISNSDDFKPGAEIKISAVYGKEDGTLFEGVIVKHGIDITGDSRARLVIECRDPVVAMTIGRHNANFVDTTDGDIITRLIGNYTGLDAEVDSTTVTWKELVQYYCTDWDFMVSRAEVNGLLVTVDDGTVSVKAPQTGETPQLEVTYGGDLMEFHADIDARTQLSAVKGTSWDLKTQAIVEGKEAAAPALGLQGDMKSAELAQVTGPKSFRLQTPAPMEKTALEAWSDGQQLKSGLARVRGVMKFQGNSLAKPGGVIQLKGVGDRFNGNAFISSVTHQITTRGWTTEAEFGMSPDWFAERRDLVAPPAAGLTPGVQGLQIGVVTKLDEDPEGQNKVQVSVPVLQADTEGVWARLATPYASESFGTFFIPDIGDEVVLGYFNDDPSNPVILGSMYSSSRKPPYDLTAENFTKAIVTKEQLKLEFDDEKKVITILTPGNNQIVISDDEKSIVLKDQNDNQVTLNEQGITLDSPKDIRINAKGKITISATGEIGISSKADVKTDGMNVNISAKTAFLAKGNATAELSASGQTTVKGAMVMIN